MSSPQEPARRHRQKIRRSKQLAVWRDKNPQKELPSAATSAGTKEQPKKVAAPKKAAAAPTKK